MQARTEIALVSAFVSLLTACGSSSSGGGSGGTSDAGHDAALGGAGGSAGFDAASGGTAGSAAGGASGASTGGAAGGAGTPTCTPNGGVSQADCQGLCEHVATASCPNDPAVTTCTSGCQSELDNYANDCEPKSAAYVDCQKTATLSCSSTGEYEAAGCDSEYQDFLGCTACIAVPGDACSCCNTQYCCTERKALFLDPNLLAFIACRDTCGPSPGCWEQVCDAQYPVTSTNFYNAIYCTEGLCHDECG